MAEFSISEGSFNPVAATEDTRSFGDVSAGLLPPAPKGPEIPPVGFDETTNTVFVNGFKFDAADHDSALRSKEAMSGPLVPMPQNYRPVDVEEFGKYINRIQDPSIGRIIKKNFGIGVDNLQLLGGRGLQYLDPALPFDANKAGQKIVDEQIEDLRFTQPYQRLFTDIDSAGGAVEWFVANLAQQGPMLIESALSAIAGGIVGGLVGGGPNPFTAIGGAFLALSGKAAVKKAVIEAAKKHAAGETLDIAEKKLLREVASGAVARELKTNAKKISPVILSKEGIIKDFLGEAGLARGGAEALKRGKLQASIGGAIVGRYVNSVGIGVSDIYGEQIESGTENRGAAFGLAIPYGLAESIPELLGLGFFIRGGKSLATSVSKAGRGIRALKRTGRAAAGGGIAAFGEGTTEAFQEALLLSQNPEVDAGSAEGINRLINSFAAGAGVGGAVGVVGGAVRGTRALEGDNVDILNPYVRIGPALLGGPDTPLQLKDLRPPSEPILQGGPVAPVEPTAPAAPAAPPAPVPPAPTPITPTAPDVDVDFLPGAGPVETQAFLAAQEPLVNPAIAAAPVTQQRNLVRERFERDAAVAAMPIQGELPITPVAQETPPVGFPAAVPALQERVDPSFIPPSEIELQGAQNLLRPTVFDRRADGQRATSKGEEALFVRGRAVPVRQLLEKSEQRKEALEELHNCLSKKG